MAHPNPLVDACYAKAKLWPEELRALRAILLAAPVDEERKWYKPVYSVDGGNVAIVWEFKEFCALGFFKGVLLKDPENMLVAPGDNSRSVRMAKFTSVAEIKRLEPLLKAYLEEAIALEKSGAKVEFAKDDLDMPQELRSRLDADAALKKAFEALTPGRQRGYFLHFSAAKQSATRAARIEKFVPKIMAGKGFQDR